MLKLFLALSLIFATSSAVRPGPVVIATKGEVWPKPQTEVKSEKYFIIRPHSFTFQPPADVGCVNFLDDALKRYWTLIAITGSLTTANKRVPTLDANYVGYLDSLNIELTGDCPDEEVRPDFGDDESYSLTISATAASTLSAPSIWGVLRGLETFSQLAYMVDGAIWINVTTITDFPRFPHRGLLLDTSRHYLPVSIILETLDAMAYNKFNVFHWHITDDHSFPYQSRTFPELSIQGAYHPVAKIYDQVEVRRIIEYARLRGIRVIPEFDTPGHTQSWGVAYPELLTTCYSDGQATGELGPMDPSKSSTYDFITKLFTEVVEVFPDSYFHIGGDEVDFGCWQSNADIAAFMTLNNMTDYSQLESYFIQKVVDLLNDLQAKYLVWEEVFVNGVDIPNSTVVHVWRGNGFSTLDTVTKAGKFGLFSSCWYLDQLANGGDWQKFYNCEPLFLIRDEEQRKLVLGGEACMWAEAVNEYNVVPRIWPRASATAEKLWSAEDVNDAEAAKARLEEHTCRMNTRGIRAQPPNGPGLFITLTLIVASHAIDPGPAVIATKGEVWPKPQQQQKSSDYLVIRPHIFSFKVPNDVGCPDFLDDALIRYWRIISSTASLERRGRLQEVGKPSHKKFWHSDANFVGYLDSLKIDLSGECQDEDVRPDFGDVENYTLTVTTKEATLSAPSIWGFLRGLETFSQLIYLEEDALIINATTINDFPRFPHRGLLLDTSRHFIPVYVILETLEAMAYNKFNVFHWHITDDQSFPFKSHVFPELSDKGAYHPISKVYQPNDVKKIIEYARLRGIRVIPEIDTPGHTRSWGVSHPELLTTCYSNATPTGELGPLDPTKNATYKFLTKLFTEVVNVFPDSYFHIGGDEVDFACWKSNPQIAAFMKKNDIKTYSQLEDFYVQKVLDLLHNLNSKHLVWEEVFVNGVNIPNSTVVHIWRDDGIETLNNVTKAGKLAIFSSCWYLDHLAEGGDWLKFYNCEILDFPGTDQQKKLVLGGEACMWTESVNEYNLISRVWPRASAAAEKLWSAKNIDVEDAATRLEEHACRMNHRGIQAEPPNGPGVCL
ncbi:beta-hexosaminidase subunit alpha-like [Asbolus verrucosus]|uniref:beta-N-acetylhexosaminidase n=1 Tax=Asbolus verrucosus TaxID=1661398 RepID=A0A482VQW7_ASBVE|nr:beta-hexosaminidase subunit alpha-like [Asbolus verrucosus]